MSLVATPFRSLLTVWKADFLLHNCLFCQRVWVRSLRYCMHIFIFAYFNQIALLAISLYSLTPPLFTVVFLSESTSGQNILTLWVHDYGRVSILTFVFSSKNKSFPISCQNFSAGTGCATTVTMVCVVRLLLSIYVNMLSTSSWQTWSFQNSVFVLCITSTHSGTVQVLFLLYLVLPTE